MRIVTFILLVFICLFSCTTFAQEKVSNPIYENWAKFKVGTTTKYQQEAEKNGKKTVSGEMIYKLVELDSEKVVVEISQTLYQNGKKTELPIAKNQFMAKVIKRNEQLLPTLKKSDEEVEVPYGKIKCRAIETSNKWGEYSMVSKTWTNSDIPGFLVKQTTDMETPEKSITTISLVQMTGKK